MNSLGETTRNCKLHAIPWGLLCSKGICMLGLPVQRMSMNAGLAIPQKQTPGCMT